MLENIKEVSQQVVVAIGASAGGLEALQEFFKVMPVNSGLSFVVIQHLSPDYKSMMDELLARVTTMKIYNIQDGMEIEPDAIFLIPPRKNLSIFHNKLFLEDYNIKKGLNLPIDIFFRSLAQEKAKDGIGIILSGTGSDGALGTKAIKEAGGMVMVQDEETAKFDGMPRSSVQTGLVDFILPPEKMPKTLIEYVKHPFIQKSKATEKILSNEGDSLTKIILILRDYCGIDFSYYKSNTIVRRLERRVSINRCQLLDDYLVLLSESDKEKEILYRDLLIGVTRFFRDIEAFQIIRGLFDEMLKTNRKNIRIWSAACSTGEEVYSLAMMLNEIIVEKALDCEVKIFATDIDRQALVVAGQGYYPDNIMVDVDASMLSKHFSRVEGGYQINETIRRMVVFATHNLLKDPPFSKIDLLVCRNLFIYLKTEVQTRLLSMFHNCLTASGILFMGSSETIGEMSDGYIVIDSKNKIYRRNDAYKIEMHKMPGITNMKSGAYLSDIVGTNMKLIPAARSERLLEKILPLYIKSAIIIDTNDNIVQIIGDINFFSKINQGRFSNNLYAILPDSLGKFVSSLLRRLRKSGNTICTETAVVIPELDKKQIYIEAHSVQTEFNTYNLLVFNEQKEKKLLLDDKIETFSVNNDSYEKITSLERELQYSREALQATIEELETSNEELQSSNEELIASNEELQSTNEELQSVNEELYTVNSEFQLKIAELERMHNDMVNLLNNTEIGALYLDRNLCIRKITPTITKITNIIPSDIGRPITHIASFANDSALMNDILHVTETLQSIESEYIATNNNNYLVRTRPYRIESNAVDGILITFVDINQYVNEKTKVTLLSQRLSSALEIGRMAWWEWDIETGNVRFDDKKATMLGYTPEEFPTQVYDICNYIHPDDYEYTMDNMRKHLEGKTPNYDVIYRIKCKDESYKWYFDKGKIVERNPDNSPKKLIGTVIDVSELKELEAELKRSKE
jgi:two-component system CheB/CheR fusion protein